MINKSTENLLAHALNIQMSSDEMLQELQKVHASLKALETGSPIAIETTLPTPTTLMPF